MKSEEIRNQIPEKIMSAKRVESDELPVSAEPKAEVKAEAKKDPVVAAEPAVEAVPKFEPGQKVKHVNGYTYAVRYQTEEGVALEGVANLVEPAQLRAV